MKQKRVEKGKKFIMSYWGHTQFFTRKEWIFFHKPNQPTKCIHTALQCTSTEGLATETCAAALELSN